MVAKFLKRPSECPVLKRCCGLGLDAIPLGSDIAKAFLVWRRTIGSH